MKNRLPLPLKTLKNLQHLINENSNNLYVANPLNNICRYIVEYDFANAIMSLRILKMDYPNLMDYDKNIALIKAAYKRYENI